jgi:lipopolysaccharide export system permease protein
VWVTNGDDMVRADLVIGRGAATRLQGVRLYDRQGNSIARIIKAERAVQVPGAWQLQNVTVYDSGQNMIRKLPSLRELVGVEPGRFTLAKIDPETRSLGRLRDNIAELRAAGRQTDAVETGLWHKISEPLSTILMPLLAAVAAFGLARSGQVLARAAIGMALGFAYFVADNFALAMGNVGAYPPLLAAWAPFLLFLLIGETVLVRSEE